MVAVSVEEPNDGEPEEEDLTEDPDEFDEEQEAEYMLRWAVRNFIKATENEALQSLTGRMTNLQNM